MSNPEDCIIEISDVRTNASGSISTIPFPTITTVGTYFREPEEKIAFSCPYCGTHYLAKDPGFIPNCHNCGAVMRKGG